MELRERRVAQIVRDFCEAYTLSERIGGHLAAGDLDFARVERLVGESEQSTLYRLKEECHALFRLDLTELESQSELQAEELFDLAVGALFHEAMRFRESYYLTTAYGPRLERMLDQGGSGSLARAFERLFEAGNRRMRESHAETQELLRETREQLRILLRQAPRGGVLARSLVEPRERTEKVFGLALPELLDEVFASSAEGYRLAVSSLVDHGHYAQAVSLLDRDDVKPGAGWDGARSLVEGLDAFYAGRTRDALDCLEAWADAETPGDPGWVERAASVCDRSTDPRNGGGDLRERALGLAARLRKRSRP